MKPTDVFRAVLQARVAQLSNGNGVRETLAVESTPDDLDRIQEANERDFAVINLQRSATQLQEAQDALDRIEGGTFGICAGCEEPINPKRLAAIPWALCCIACQTALDLGQETTREGVDQRILLAA